MVYALALALVTVLVPLVAISHPLAKPNAPKNQEIDACKAFISVAERYLPSTSTNLSHFAGSRCCCLTLARTCWAGANQPATNTPNALGVFNIGLWRPDGEGASYDQKVGINSEDPVPRIQEGESSTKKSKKSLVRSKEKTR